MNQALYIAKRYLFSKSQKNAVNIISRIAVAAVILGSTALFVVLSGFSGLKDFALEYTNIFDSDIKITPETGKTFVLSNTQLEDFKTIPEIHGVSKIVEDRIFIRYDNKNFVAYIKGVDSSYPNNTPVDSLLFLGDWLEQDQDEVVIGFGISAKLGLPIRDYGTLIELYAPKPGTGQINVLEPTSAFASESVVASGIYEVNEELNIKYVFSDIHLARRLLSVDSLSVSSLELKLNAPAQEEVVKQKIKAILGEHVVIRNRIQQNDALYKMLNAENLFTYLFVSLIAAIAIFNLAGTIIMIILEKRGNIKTLYFMGFTIKDIRKIFFFNGFFMTLIGVLVGLLLGSVLVLLQMKYGFVPITPTLPYPVKFNLINLLIVFSTILVLGGLASKLASMRVTEKLLN